MSYVRTTIVWLYTRDRDNTSPEWRPFEGWWGGVCQLSDSLPGTWSSVYTARAHHPEHHIPNLPPSPPAACPGYMAHGTQWLYLMSWWPTCQYLLANCIPWGWGDCDFLFNQGAKILTITLFKGNGWRG